MNSPVRRRIAVPVRLVVLAGLVLLLGCFTAIRKHPEFHGRILTITSVGVMPPEVHFVRKVFKGSDERLRDREAALVDTLHDSIASQFGRYDFVVRKIELDEETYAEFPDLRFETSLAQDAHGKAMGEMYETPMMSRSEAERYERSLGPSVNLFANFADVDALIFARLSGYEKSGGEIAKDVLIGTLAGVYTASESATLQVSLVDGTSGDLLWSNLVAREGGLEGGGLQELAARAFENFQR